jgi:hypothetical protein
LLRSQCHIQKFVCRLTRALNGSPTSAPGTIRRNEIPLMGNVLDV